LPLIDYCCVVWGNCSNERLNRILKLQKRTASGFYFKYTGASFFRHFETRRYLWYLILCSILIHPSCLNRGSDGAMGS
jgi:hypothetical protein